MKNPYIPRPREGTSPFNQMEENTEDYSSKPSVENLKEKSGIGNSPFNKMEENTEDDSSKPSVENLKEKSGSGNKWLIAAISIALLSFIVFILFLRGPTRSPKEILRSSINDLKLKFVNQPRDVWLEVLSGLSKTLENDPNVPSSFLFIYEEEKKTSECLARHVGDAAALILNSNSSNATVLDVKNWNFVQYNNDYGELMIDLKEQIIKTNALIVLNLNKFPINMVSVFHSLCDEYGPVLERAAYFFTLSINTSNSGISPSQKANAALHELWKDLRDYELDPLLSRITGRVIEIAPEKNIPC